MGFGAAFATGLVQGFTQNIQEEKARRLADQQKIDALNQLLVKSSMDKDASTSGIQAVTAMIKSAQKDLDSREPIDIFGRQTDGLDIDFTKLAGIVNKKEVTGNTVITAGDDSLIFNSQWGKTVNANTAMQFLQEVPSMSDEDIAKVKRNPQLLRSLQGQINGAMGVLNEANITNVLGAGKGIDSVLPLDYSFLDVLYNRLDMEIPSTTKINAESVASGVKKNTGEVVDSVFVQESGVQTVTFEDPAQKASLGVIAKTLGTDTVNAGNVFVDKHKNVPLMSPKRASNIFLGSVNIGTIPGIRGLDPDLYLKKMSSQDKEAVLTSMAAEFGDPNIVSPNTFNDMVYALAPHMTPPQRKKVSVAGRDVQSLGYSRNDYVLKRTGDLYKTFGELEDAARRNTDTVDNLEQYRTVLANLEEGTIAYASFKTTLGAFVDIGGSVVGDVAGFFSGEEDEGETYFVDQTQVDAYVKAKVDARRQEGAKSGQGRLFAELEAMRISLAFQLARAADPSGRLSNQDIEVQLTRLGSNFRTKADALRALSVVIDDVTRERDRLNILASMGGTDDITDSDARVVDATVAVHNLVVNRNRLAARGKYVATAVQKTYPAPPEGAQPSTGFTSSDGSPVFLAMDGPVPMMENNKPIYTDIEGNRVTDLKLIEAPAAAAAPTPSATVTAQPSEPTPVVKPEGVPVPPPSPEEENKVGNVRVDAVFGVADSPYDVTVLPDKKFRIRMGGSDLGIFTLNKNQDTFVPAQ